MRLRELSNKVFRIYTSLPIKFAIRTNKKLLTELTAAFCNNIESIGDEYASILYRPKNAEGVTVLDKRYVTSNEKIGIVIQGPPLYENSFTIETIKLYKKIFDNVEIIVSTWEDVKEDYLTKVRDMGCSTICNKKPSVSGVGNMNFQVVSTLAGVKKAKELGCSYVMKTRSDQRLYNYNSCLFLLDLLRLFPTQNKNQKSRIVVVQGGGGNIFLPFYTADFFYFGHVDDMEKLFSVELSELDFKNRAQNDQYDKDVAKGVDLGTLYHMQAPQNHIMESYANKIGCRVENTVRCYWEFLRECLIGISTEEIGLYWRKYSRNVVENTWIHSYEPSDSAEQMLTYNLNFVNWMSIYTGSLKYNSEFERYRKRKPNV